MKVSESADLILRFEAVRSKDVPLVGGKVASLGELTSIGIPVPPGFAITAAAYQRFMNSSGLERKISSILEDLDVNEFEDLHKASDKIRGMMEATPFHSDLEAQTAEAYRRLAESLGVKNPEVAVRSSATAEDLPSASFAGQQETYLFISGEQSLLTAVKKCFSSLFSPRAIFYRTEKHFDHMSVLLSVGVQKMLNSKASGVIFTLNPLDGDTNVVVIEASWGVGESIAQGHVIPDRFLVKKSTLDILDRQISSKRVMTVRSQAEDPTQTVKEVEVPPELESVPCLTDGQVLELAKLAIGIEEHYGGAMDVEWALDNDTDRLFIVQARPETVWREKLEATAKAEVRKAPKLAEAKALVRGLGASPGRASGKTRIILDVKEIGRFKQGEILVTEMTSPDWVPAMRKASAIVTDSGGTTAHAAIVSRELGIPCVVGTKNATHVLKMGDQITVDGTLGLIYPGVLPAERPAPAAPAAGTPFMEPAPVTATKIYMNLGEPGKIDDYRHLPFDGIGLMRVEFTIADSIREHPLYMIEKGRSDVFVERLAEAVAKVAGASHPRPVVVRFSDFKTNEYRQLKGGDKFEPPESNPMLGWRGVSRYASKEFEAGFRLECKTIRKVREEMGLKNVWAMLPFVRTTWEVKKAEQIMEEEGLKRGKDFQLWLMVEVPSMIILADEFSKLCDGFSIGSNDLTQLTLGADRDSAILGRLGYFDERDPSILRSMKHLIKVAHRNGVTVSICGQAPSVYPEIAEFLVKAGADSMSVNPDVVLQTKKLVASFEQKTILQRLAKLDDEKDAKDFKPEW